MQIDCYGFEASSQWFKRRTLDPNLGKKFESEQGIAFRVEKDGSEVAV